MSSRRCATSLNAWLRDPGDQNTASVVQNHPGRVRLTAGERPVAMRKLLPHSLAGNILLLFTICAALVLSGCASGSGTTSSTATPATSRTASATAATSTAKSVPRRPEAGHRPRPPKASRRGSGSLPYSTASNDVVQKQPPPGSCHATGSGLYSRPDPACTPGALNPAVRQSTSTARFASRAGPRRCARPRASPSRRRRRAWPPTATLGP